MQKSLPAWATVIAAYTVTFGHFRSLLALAWKWIVFILVPAIALINWLDAGQIADHSDLLYAVAIVAHIVAYAAVAVAWHRFLLRSDRATTLRVDVGVLRYVAIDFCIVTITFLLLLAWSTAASALVVIDLHPAIAALAGSVILIILFLVLLLVRISLILPAIAVNNSAATVGSIRAATKGHVLALGLGSFFTLGLIVLVGFMSLAVETLDISRHGQRLLMAMSEVLNFVLFAVWWTYLSLAYRALFEPEVALPD